MLLEKTRKFWSEVDEVMQNIYKKVMIGDLNGHLEERNRRDEEIRNQKKKGICIGLCKNDSGYFEYLLHEEEHRVTYKSAERSLQLDRGTAHKTK